MSPRYYQLPYYILNTSLNFWGEEDIRDTGAVTIIFCYDRSLLEEYGRIDDDCKLFHDVISDNIFALTIDMTELETHSIPLGVFSYADQIIRNHKDYLLTAYEGELIYADFTLSRFNDIINRTNRIADARKIQKMVWSRELNDIECPKCGTKPSPEMQRQMLSKFACVELINGPIGLKYHEDKAFIDCTCVKCGYTWTVVTK